MNIAVIGGNSSEIIAKNIKMVQDNLSIEIFKNLDSMQTSSLQRRFYFDRILLTSSVLKGNTIDILKEFHSYLRDYSIQTEVVLMCVADKDDKLAIKFSQMFTSPLHIATLLKETSIITLKELATNDVESLRQKYGNIGAIEVDIDSEVYEIEQPKPKEPENNQTKQEGKKKGLFSRFNFTKKNKKSEEKSENEPKSDKTNEEEWDFEVDLESNTLGSKFNPQEDTLDDTELLDNSNNSYDNNSLDQHKEDIVSITEFDNLDINSVNSTNINSKESKFDFKSNEEEQDISSGIHLGSEITDNFNIANEDLEDNDELLVISSEEPAIKSSTKLVNEEVKEIDTSLGTVGNLEEAYQEDTTEKVIIEKEVIIDKSKGRVKNILEGKIPALFIVTGTGGAGTTTTGIDILNFFAKKVPCLYVDFDRENYGVLNYLNYNEIRNYSGNLDAQLQGIRMCSNSTFRFENCLISYDNNIDLLLTNYCEEVTDENIINAQEIIADKLNDFNVIVVDVPLKDLHLCEDLLSVGSLIINMEASKRGFMNTLLHLDENLSQRQIRLISTKGIFALTKLSQKSKFNLKEMQDYVNDCLEFELDWSRLPIVERKKDIKELLEEALRR